jgi:hypothetical protein
MAEKGAGVGAIAPTQTRQGVTLEVGEPGRGTWRTVTNAADGTGDRDTTRTGGPDRDSG